MTFVRSGLTRGMTFVRIGLTRGMTFVMLQRDIVTLPSVRPSHPCEYSRINILQWILTKLGTYLVLKRIWIPIDFQGQRSRSPGKSFTAYHPCEHSRINILQWIWTKLGTYLVLRRVWNPIDFQGQRSMSTGQNIAKKYPFCHTILYRTY